MGVQYQHLKPDKSNNQGLLGQDDKAHLETRRGKTNKDYDLAGKCNHNERLCGCETDVCAPLTKNPKNVTKEENDKEG